jgi:hypothetical protein
MIKDLRGSTLDLNFLNNLIEKEKASSGCNDIVIQMNRDTAYQILEQNCIESTSVFPAETGMVSTYRGCEVWLRNDLGYGVVDVQAVERGRTDYTGF